MNSKIPPVMADASAKLLMSALCKLKDDKASLKAISHANMTRLVKAIVMGT